MSLVLALDAMGGDLGPHVVIEGAGHAIKHGIDAHFMVFGDETQIKPLLKSSPHLEERITLIHTDEVITNDTKPSTAIRGFKNSSMRLAISAVAHNQAAAVVSAGNTGAYMALSKILLRTLEGVDRPAIATSIPTLTGACIALDLGANVDCSVENLIQFAIMGEVMARRILHKDRPKVGLLNVGAEELKGSAVVQQAAQELRLYEDIHFEGFVEGNDLTSGRVDVVVTDGFTGNVALKTIEGVAHMIMKTVKDSLSSSWRGKLGYLVASPAFAHIRQHFDPRLYNGAAFLGLKGIAVKSHGGTDGIGFGNAIVVAGEMAHDTYSHNMGQEIEEKLKHLL
jgi:glycerol-3-phosphate acyltransferase PlsX